MLDMFAQNRCRSSGFAEINCQHGLGIDMHNVCEQQGILATTLAGSLKPRCVELVGNEGVIEVFSRRFKPSIGFKIAQKLFFPVGLDTPLRTDERSFFRWQQGRDQLSLLFHSRVGGGNR